MLEWTEGRQTKTNAKLHLSNQFHDDKAKNVTSIVFKRKTAPPPPGGHAKNVTSLEKTAPPTGGHVFSLIWTIFELMFKRKTAPPTGGHVFQRNRTTFELNQYIIKTSILTNIIWTKLLTKFHEDPTNDGERPITKAHLSNQNVIDLTFEQNNVTNVIDLTMEQNDDIDLTLEQNVTGRMTLTYIRAECDRKDDIDLTLEQNNDIDLTLEKNETNVLSKFHENWSKNVTSTVFTCFHYIHIEKNALPTGGHVFSPIPTIFKLLRDINKTNVLTNFHDDWAKIVTSRVFTRENCHYIHIEKNAWPTGSHVFTPILTIFEPIRDIN
ncbi:hypothetical protein DPMN_001074 [Dreissena polymorpha]|uniref:Uncharacterized protein n=1 Tax=Dreissena polymorpha TaxID=45954 RepID=A0A9D4RSH5_DREPO|nr:hypothetical protein DPMN_001074 [Dreissena polymorpha]